MINKQSRQRNYMSAPQRAQVRPAEKKRPGISHHSRRQTQLLLRRLITIALVITIALLAVYGILQIPRGASVPKTIDMKPNDPYTPFNGGLLYMSKGQLYHLNSKGVLRALLPLGEDGAYYASGQMIVAWRGMQIYVMDANGDILYNERMSTPIQFARVGASYVATLFANDDGTQRIDVTTHAGTPVWSIDVGADSMLDMGFFGTQDLRLWTIALDTKGTTPASIVASYEPKRYETTGGNTLYDQIVYRIYQRGSSLMMVNSATITAYDYRCAVVSGVAPVTVYGWQMHDMRTVSGDPWTLFTQISAGSVIRTARLISGSGDSMLRFPAACMDVRLGARCVYAFTTDTVYVARYGQNQFTAHALPWAIDRVLCIMDGDRAVVASGNDVFWVDLPSR